MGGRGAGTGCGDTGYTSTALQGSGRTPQVGGKSRERLLQGKSGIVTVMSKLLRAQDRGGILRKCRMKQISQMKRPERKRLTAINMDCESNPPFGARLARMAK